jgi:hypothetical protein
MGNIEQKLAERAAAAEKSFGCQDGQLRKPIVSKKARVDEVSTHPAYVSCPVCHTAYKVHFSTSVFEQVEDGIARVLVTPPCSHKFLVFVDSNLRTRGVERIDHDGLVCEHADTEFLEKHIKQLEDQHSQLAKDKDYNEAFEIMQQIKSAKKELDALKNKIVVK